MKETGVRGQGLWVLVLGILREMEIGMVQDLRPKFREHAGRWHLQEGDRGNHGEDRYLVGTVS
jgi:hypothetical protein